MRHCLFICVIVAAISSLAFAQTAQPAQGRDLNTGQSFAVNPGNGQPPPKEWIDKDTGHRVVRLTDEPGSQSLYFNYPAYSPDGKKLTFTSPTGIYQVDLETRAIEKIIDGASTLPGNVKVRNNIIQVGLKTGKIFFTRTAVDATDNQGAGYNVSQDRGSADRTVWWIDPVTKQEHKIGDLPINNNVGTVNSDETLLGGAVTYLDGRNGAPTTQVRAAPGQRIDLGARWRQHLPMELLTMSVATGEIKKFNPSNDWDNHFLFSPGDPTLLMYCHEGPWQENDRIWLIHTDGTGLLKPHARTMMNEIWGHEFWSADGKTVWYQLSYGGSNWIAGYNVETHKHIWYLNAPGTGSIHVNVSKDGSLFAGDGNNGYKWVFLEYPQLSQGRATAYDPSTLIQPGRLTAERLVNMQNHQYQLEPNPSFTYDGKWVVFRSNMFGPSYVFAAEVAKAK